MNGLALGRRRNDFGERQETLKNGETKTKLVKVGAKFKAGGGESFGYKPHRLLELSLERRNRNVNGQGRDGEGRMVHRADVLKDRTWALNGRTFRWMDKAKYEAGGYRQVWESIRPHFEEVQATMQPVIILAGPVLPPAPAQGSDFGRPLVGVQDAQRTFQLFELELVTAAFWTSPTR